MILFQYYHFKFIIPLFVTIKLDVTKTKKEGKMTQRQIAKPKGFSTVGFSELETEFKIKVSISKTSSIKDEYDTRFDMMLELTHVFTEEILNYIENKMTEEIQENRSEDGCMPLEIINSTIKDFNKNHLDNLLVQIKDVMSELKYTDNDDE